MKRLIQYTLTLLAAGTFYMCGDGEEKKTEASAEENKINLPGDDLDLYAVLNLFKESKSPEAFEKKLNDKSGKVNNLDLDENGKVDYIRVVDQREGDAHTIVLRVPVSAQESQDVAVIEIKKTGDKTAHLQIVGDEELYGKEYIVEPKSEEKSAGFITVATVVAVNVWAWPAVTYVYSPDYVVVYESPYYYEYYPVWWEPWPPVAYEAYYPVVYPYHTYYYQPAGYMFVDVHQHYVSHVRYSSPYVREQAKYYAPRHTYDNNGTPRRNDGFARSGHRGNGGNNGGGRHDNAPPAQQPRTAPRDGNGSLRTTPHNNDRNGSMRTTPKNAPQQRTAPRNDNNNKGGGSMRRGAPKPSGSPQQHTPGGRQDVKTPHSNPPRQPGGSMPRPQQGPPHKSGPPSAPHTPPAGGPPRGGGHQGGGSGGGHRPR